MSTNTVLEVRLPMPLPSTFMPSTYIDITMASILIDAKRVDAPEGVHRYEGLSPGYGRVDVNAERRLPDLRLTGSADLHGVDERRGVLVKREKALSGGVSTLAWRRGDVATWRHVELTARWQARWPDCPPIGHELKRYYTSRWVRFHSLPGSKRYADTPAEYDILLDRHNTVLTELFDGQDALIVMVTHCRAGRPAVRGVAGSVALPRSDVLGAEIGAGVVVLSLDVARALAVDQLRRPACSGSRPLDLFLHRQHIGSRL
ncbi:hypothetical protein ACFWY5_56185 [Nonomuraea sp. NPDC059007]|uniref:DUF3885 domain-containing protein n=1 Tax=Nonomuraea sp. NPDC059007 TaxID=3346692 RepID=UPI0036CFC1AB